MGGVESAGSQDKEELEAPVEPAARAAQAALVMQASFRAHVARKDCRLLRTKGELLMRTNLPADWSAEQGVPAGLEFEERRHLSFVHNQLVVTRVQRGCFPHPAGGADFVLHAGCVEKVGARAARARARALRCASAKSRQRQAHEPTRRPILLSRAAQVFTDPEQPTVFALGMGGGTQRDVLFRAPDVSSRDAWLRAVTDAASRCAVKLASDERWHNAPEV